MAEFTFRGFILAQAVDALKAYDSGATDSGIKDDEMREAVRSYLKGLPEAERRRVLAVLGRDRLTDEAIAAGYGLADVVDLYHWLDGLGVEPL